METLTTFNFTEYAGQAVGGDIAQRLSINTFTVVDLANLGNLIRAAGVLAIQGATPLFRHLCL